MKRIRLAAALAGVLLLVPMGTARAGDPITGAGSTFAQKVIQQWATAAAGQGIQVTYTGTGSGDGRLKLGNGEVDFAGSDLPAPPADAEKLNAKYGGFVHVTITSAGIGVVYNASEFADLKLTAPTLAKIFSGTITNWNDPAVAADNGSAGPDLPIKVLVRADKSGSSGVFSGYLEAAGEGNWKGGTTESFPAPANGEGRQGGSALAQGVIDTRGAIGYVDHGTAIGKKLAEVRVKNPFGSWRGPEAGAVASAIDEAKQNPDGTLTLTYEPKGENAYPISTVSYVIAPTKMGTPGKAETLKNFLKYALSKAGQDQVPSVGYAPLPDKITTISLQQTEKISG